MKKSKKFLLGAVIVLAGATAYSYFKDKLREASCDVVSKELKNRCEECENPDDVTEDNTEEASEKDTEKEPEDEA